MKTYSTVFAMVSILIALPVSAQTTVNLGSIDHFAGPGDLDLDGNIVKAVNFNGPDLEVNGVTFSSDAGDPDFVGPQNVVGWQNRPEFGGSSDDDNLEAIMHDIRWANSANNEFLEAHIPVTAGQEYKLQVLISGNHQETRVWDIEIEGLEAVDGITSLGLDTDTYNAGESVVYTLQEVAPDDVLDIRMGQIFGETFGADLNPIWQGLTLEAVPEPTSTGPAVLLAVVAWMARGRRRKT